MRQSDLSTGPCVRYIPQAPSSVRHNPKIFLAWAFLRKNSLLEGMVEIFIDCKSHCSDLGEYQMFEQERLPDEVYRWKVVLSLL